MAEYIHGSSDEREVRRLIRQAAFVAPFTLADFPVHDGALLLDLATGVGAMAAQLRRYFPGARIVGADLKLAQLRHAKALHPVADYVQANGARLPFRDQSFDRVHCSWLLEHIPTPPGPVTILREVRRVLKPDGLCHFIEVDNSSFLVTPSRPEVVEVMAAMNEAQQRVGGDPYAGQKLGRYFQEAGFGQVELRESTLFGNAQNPLFMREFAEEFAEIFESLDEALGPKMAPRIAAAAAALRALPDIPGAELRYRGFIARARP